MTPLQKVQQLLPQLTPADRKKLRLLLSSQFRGDEVKARRGEEDGWLLQGILTELTRRGLTYKGTNEEGVNRLAPHFFEEASHLQDDLRARLERSMKHKLNTETRYNHLLTLGNFAARALAEHLEPVAPVGLKLMLTNISKLPEAIESSYPGYLRAGMLCYLVRSHKKQRDARVEE